MSAKASAKVRPLHVAHLIEALGPGGAERLLYTNLKHFDSARVRSTVVTVYSRATHWREPIRELGVEVYSLDCAGPRDFPRGVARLRDLIKRTRPDLLHTHLWGANVIGRAAGFLAGVPVVSSVHNPDYEPEAWNDGSSVSLRKRKLIRGIDRWTARFACDRMVAVSDYVRRSTHRRLGFPLERTDLLYNPIDAELFSAPAAGAREKLLGELGLPGDSLVLLNVARTAPQKGFLYAVRALPKILERHPKAHLLSVGATTDPQWVERLKEEISTLGLDSSVHILGARRDVPELLRACDVFVFPSLYEGLGIALIEAMAAGCACVTTNTGPLPEVVRDGVDGLLVPPADHEALARAVNSLLDDPARRAALGEEATRSALERFQPQQAADRLTEIYESVAGRR
ncbi:MAG TPA: glycosyltransferase family 4 protein [Pyrinomonadaceae bacterium]|jgi:glycosyltransferase involved in cell wall biosynthesis|nr:glycosyltransferase family 4 protein [Pyrinomonadaceae bacterium]